MAIQSIIPKYFPKKITSIKKLSPTQVAIKKALQFAGLSLIISEKIS
jgi:hypothetical protein